MTIGICVVASDGVVFAADGRLMSDTLVQANTCNKIERWHGGKSPLWVVSAGNVDVIQQAQNQEPTTVKEVAEAFREAGKKDKSDIATEALVYYRGVPYHLDGSHGLTEVNAWAVVGSGGPHAMGLMSWFWEAAADDWQVTTSADWKGDLETVMYHVSQVNPQCGPPYSTKVWKR